MHLVQTLPTVLTTTPREGAMINPASARVTAAAEGNLKILNILETNSEVMCCRFDPSGSLLAVGLANGVIKIFSPDSGHCVYSLSDQDTFKSHLPVTCLRWRPVSDGNDYGNVLLATYADGRIKMWHVSSSSCVGTINEPAKQILACAYNSSGGVFVTAGSDTTLNVYDERTKQVICTLQPSSSHLVMDGHMSRIFSVQFTPGQDQEFISGGWDDTVQFWDTRTDSKHSVRKIFGPHICGDALDIQSQSSSTTSRQILTGSWRKDKTLQIWDYGSGKLVKDVPSDYNGSMLYCVQWQGPDNIIAGGSDNNMMRCVDQGTYHTTGRVVDLPRAVYTVDYDRRSHNPFIAAGTSNFVYLVKRS